MFVWDRLSYRTIELEKKNRRRKNIFNKSYYYMDVMLEHALHSLGTALWLYWG